MSNVQDSARSITARVRSTPLEYSKQLGGSTEFQNGGTVAQALTEAKRSLTSTLADAEWLGPSQRRDLETAIDGL